MSTPIRIGTRESQLAVWQATQVLQLLTQAGHPAELVFIRSEGDIDLSTPLYEMGVQGIFTKTLDAALLGGSIDLAVHSMKDVPTQPARGLVPAAVLPRGPVRDILVHKPVNEQTKRSWITGDPADTGPSVIASSSIRRRAQWLNHFPNDILDNLRGNVNTRLRKLEENTWQGAIFAAAGLERIGLRPERSIDLDWMLPAPAQGAIMVMCTENNQRMLDACRSFHDHRTALCTSIEREFLRTLLGGCSTPISAWAAWTDHEILFRGNILSPDGQQRADVEKRIPADRAHGLGKEAALELLENGGKAIADAIRKEP